MSQRSTDGILLSTAKVLFHSRAVIVRVLSGSENCTFTAPT